MIFSVDWTGGPLDHELSLFKFMPVDQLAGLCCTSMSSIIAQLRQGIQENSAEFQLQQFAHSPQPTG